jgi:hypothetical protein
VKSKTSLSLESLDRREVPASLARPPLYAEEVRLEIPEGCWPGPPPAILAGDVGQIKVLADFGSSAGTIADPIEVVLPKGGM